MQQEPAELGVCRFDSDSVLLRHLSQRGFRLLRPPAPGIAKPQCRQHVQAGGLRASIAQADLDQDIGRRRFRVFDKHVEIPIIIEYAGIQQLVFRVVAAALPVRLDQATIGICVLRVFIQILHV